MFYHYLKNSPNIGEIRITDLAFDKNGRSLTKNPEKFYSWEQAHCFGWAMSSKEVSPSFIDKIYLNNIEIIDKIGAGINFSSGPTKVNSFLAQNITEKDFNGSKGLIKYGQRGDLEISCFSKDIRITDCDLRYIQIEPVKRFSSDKNNPRVCHLINSKIDVVDYTEGDNKEPEHSKFFVENIVSDKFLVRSIYFRVKDSEISIPEVINSVDGGFTNTTIKMGYNEVKNTIRPVNCSHLRTLNSINNNVFFKNCSFQIDSDNSRILPKGFALRAGGKVKSLSMSKVIIENCTFDDRLQYSIDAYANGTWILKNNKFAGTEHAISLGGYKDFVSDVTLFNNDFSKLNTNKSKIRINNNNKLWKLELDKNLIYKDPSFIFKKGSQGNLQEQIIYN